jgi:hypothetical protein
MVVAGVAIAAVLADGTTGVLVPEVGADCTGVLAPEVVAAGEATVDGVNENAAWEGLTPAF